MVTTFRLRTMAYAAGLAAVTALAGCGDGGVQAGGPSTQGPASTSTAVVLSTTSPATTTAPVDPVLARIPAAARPETDQGAAAFVQFYFEQVNDAFKTANVKTLQDLATDDCDLCSSMAEGVVDRAAQGHKYSGDLAKVTTTKVIDPIAQQRRVLVLADQMAVDVLDKSGATVDKTSEAKLQLVATVEYLDHHWVITRMQKAKS